MIVARLQLNSDSLAVIQNCSKALTADSHKWGKYYLTGIAPKDARPLYHVKL